MIKTWFKDDFIMYSQPVFTCSIIVNFEHISHLALAFLLLTLNM